MDETHATGADTLLGVLTKAREDGFDASFATGENGHITCHTCNEAFPAPEAQVDHVRRLEGASDPADMLLVAALPCPRCAVQGTIVLGFGPEAADADQAVLADLDLGRAEHRP